MSERLHSVEDYITDVRTTLLDKIEPFRYTDDELLVAFNTALLEGRRVRPDLFVFKHHSRVPSFTDVSSEIVYIEPQFRLAFVYGTCAHALARDEEDIQDARSVTFRNFFMDMLLGVRPGPIGGGTPPQGGSRQQGG